MPVNRRLPIAVAEAKARFSELLDRAQAGEAITITRHGRAVAQLVPAPESEEAAITRRTKAMGDWLAYRKEHRINIGTIEEIREMIDEGRM